MRHSVLLLFLVCLLSFVGHSQNVAIELEKMNVLYIGVENPINVVVGNHSSKKLVVKAKHGVIEPNYRGYIYKIDTCAYCMEIIYVGIKSVKGIKWLDSTYYRLKKIRDPKVGIAGKMSGEIDKRSLIQSLGIYIDSEEGLAAPIMYRVINYSVEITRNDSIIFSENISASRLFSNQLILAIENSESNDKIRFYNIIIKGPDKCERIFHERIFTIK